MKQNKTKEMNNFIDTVYLIYGMLHWKWFDKEITKEDIKKTLLDLISQIKKSKTTNSISTGGLYVKRENNGDMDFIKYGFRIENYLD